MQKPKVDEEFLASVVPDYVQKVKVFHGGFKDVYIVDTKDSRIAVKICLINQEGYGGQEISSLRERLEREWKLLNKCKSNYIVRPGPVNGGIHLYNGQSLFVFSEEFIEYPSLRERLREGRLFSIKESLVFLKCMTSLVKHFTEMGIVHKDIKPDNIFSSCPPREFIVTDLGIARVAGEAILTPTGAFLHTRGYMAPEYFNEQTKKSINYRADLFSIGIVCYELLTGTRPAEITQSQGAANISDYVVELPESLSKIIMRLLEYQPHFRYNHLYQLEEELLKADRDVNGGE